MKPFTVIGKAKKRWRGRAWLIDPKKTRVIFEFARRPRHVQLWTLKEPDQSSRELFASSRIREEHNIPK